MSGENDGCEVMNEDCTKRFDAIEERFDATDTANKQLVGKVDHVIKRLFQSNGERAVVELIRDNKMNLERHMEDTHRPAPVSTITGKPNGTKIECGPFKITTNSIEVANGMFRVLSVVLLAVIVFFGPKLLKNLEGRLLHKVESSMANGDVSPEHE